jgi:hypothetical protein
VIDRRADLTFELARGVDDADSLGGRFGALDLLVDQALVVVGGAG